MFTIIGVAPLVFWLALSEKSKAAIQENRGLDWNSCKSLGDYRRFDSPTSSAPAATPQNQQ
jgi:hypothetical protein